MLLGIGLTLPRRGGAGVGGGGAPGVTWSPTDKHSSFLLSNGNLTGTVGTAAFRGAKSTAAYQNTGKWYYEIVPTVADTGGNYSFGVAQTAASLAARLGAAVSSYGWEPTKVTPLRWNNNASAAYGATAVANDVIGIALDLVAGTLTYYKNGVSQGVAFSSVAGAFKPAVAHLAPGGNQRVSTARFASGAWGFAPPVGHLEWPLI